MEAFLMLLRWLHFLFGLTWVGILYYFNLVQVPFFAETEPAVRIGVQQKLLPLALWWFRWAAVGTVAAGLLYLLLWWGDNLDWTFTPWTVAIFTGGTIGIIMFLNVWLVIWPDQKVVIANAIAVAGGAPAQPKAAAAGRRAGLASRTNVLFSIPMLFFMGAASHYPLLGSATSAGLWAWSVLSLLAIGLVEINPLVGKEDGTHHAGDARKKLLDSISGTITAGFVLWAILVAIIKLTLG